jgi:hypothetical protein
LRFEKRSLKKTYFLVRHSATKIISFKQFTSTKSAICLSFCLRIEICINYLKIKYHLYQEIKRVYNRVAIKSRIILREWLASNNNHPFTTPEIKLELANQTGLSVLQVSNWLKNERKKIRRQLIIPDWQKKN